MNFVIFLDNEMTINDTDIMEWSMFRNYRNQEYKYIKISKPLSDTGRECFKYLQLARATVVKVRREDGTNINADDSDSTTTDDIQDGNQTTQDSIQTNDGDDVAFNIGPVEATAAVEQLEEESKRIHEHVLNAHVM